MAAGRYIDWEKQYGKWKYFHRNGRISAVEVYDNGKLTEKQYFDEQGQPTDTADRDSKAIPRGGSEGWATYLLRQIYWPGGTRFTNADQAIVTVTAWVDEEGRVTDAYVSIPLSPEFDKIALDAVKRSPKWQPPYRITER